MRVIDLKLGDEVQMTRLLRPWVSAGETRKVVFCGCTDIVTQYGDIENPQFNTLREAKAHYNVRTARQLEDLGQNHFGKDSYGHNVYCVFRDSKHEFKFTAYLFDGSWRIGSGADKFVLEKV